MRLTTEQTGFILSTIREQAGPSARVVVFGSRTNNSRRGGDLDLLVDSTPPLDLIQRARIKQTLEGRLEMPVDILAKPADAAPSPFHAIAIATGMPL